ncbi:MAG: nuclear transport factor 2 family protein [Acidimicrobiales bacterium]|jgi:hypothetical protein|nr:nuclear transport factor 2 family protein [Acidimicrobiales bacterium]
MTDQTALPLTADLLVELERIKRLKYHYMRCVDLKLWDDLVDIFTPDATASYSGGNHSFEGRDAIIGFLRDSMSADGFHSSHRVHHPEIDFLSETEAVGRWALDDRVIIEDFDVTVRGSAYYEDRYVRTDAGWRLAHTGYLRIYEEIQSREGVPGLRLTASLWRTGGRSEL